MDTFKIPPFVRKVLDNLSSTPITMDKLQTKTDLAMSTLYRAIHILRNLNQVERIDNVYPVKWIKKEKI